jgi:CRISPR/Cas system CMR-associated protein Cmr3 (group 5 of RAMP superfamily)
MQSESSSPSFFKKEVDVVITLIVDNGEFEGNMVFSQSELTYDDDVYLHELNGIRKK